MVPSERDYTISAIRAVAMGMIVLCHFFQYYGNELAYWFNVGVQMFFVISGFLYGGKKINDPIAFICKNFKKLLVPYYLYLLIVIPLYFIYASDQISLKKVIFLISGAGRVNGLGHLWFIPYILFCYLITPCLQILFEKLISYKKFVFVGSVLLGMFLMQCLGKLYHFYFNIAWISCYVIGYGLTFLLKNYTCSLRRITMICWGVCIPVSLMKVYLKYIVQLPVTSLEHLENIFFTYEHVILGLTLFLTLYMLGHRVELKKNTFLSFSDKISYHVYICHQLFILGPFTLMSMTGCSCLNWGIILVCILICALCLEKISRRILNQDLEICQKTLLCRRK